jgi:Bacterial Ig-like domain (group 3)
MSTKLRRAGAFGAAAIVMAALAFGGAASASAATPLGSVTGNPATGPTATGLPNFVSSAPCPTGTGKVTGVLNGPGWVNIPAFSTNTTDVANINTSGIPIADSFAGIAQGNGLVLSAGTYTVTLVCAAPGLGGAELGQFDGTYTLNAPGAAQTFTFAAPVAPASTTTLAVTPASPQTIGTPVTLTASVTSTATVAGTVQFQDAGANLGTPVTVTGGTAALTTSTLTGGAHSLSASFIPANPANIAASTSASVSYTINAPAQATTTTLSSSPAAPTTADVVSLTATLTPSNAAGTVTFKEGATVVGTSPVTGGTASVSLTGLSAGSHSYTADFVPTNTANFLASSASAYSITVATYAGATALENITTTVAAGTLTITAGGPTVDLGTLALNTANTLLVNSAPKDINPVTVTDTRAGSLGWNVNGVVGDFTSAAGSKINSENLGWVPSVTSVTAPQAVTAGPTVAPGAGVAVGANTGAGLKTPRLLATSAAGSSVGTAVLSAKLTLQAPTSTTAGVYNAVLTLTAI